MSCELNPKWCPVDLASPESLIRCPCCGRGHWREVAALLSERIGVDYYSVGHIPKELIITCSACELDFVITLKATVNVVKIEKG